MNNQERIHQRTQDILRKMEYRQHSFWWKLKVRWIRFKELFKRKK